MTEKDWGFYIDIDNKTIYTTKPITIGSTITYYKLKENFIPESSYSVDYANGKIFLYKGRDNTTLSILKYNTSKLYAEYIASDKINEDSYSVENGSLSITFIDYNLIDKISSYAVPIMVQYKTIEEQNSSDSKLDPYRSPFINQITFKYIEG